MSNTKEPYANGTKVIVECETRKPGGEWEKNEKKAVIVGHGYGKKHGKLIYIIDIEKVLGFTGFSGGAKPVIGYDRKQASARLVRKR